jgi:hypothetical protein
MIRATITTAILAAVVTLLITGGHRPHHDHGAAALTPRATATSCTRSKRVIRIPISTTRWPDLAAHDRAAERTRPYALHLDRPDAAEHRKESLQGIPTKPGMDRDEYAPAESREGGKGADVRYVPSGENRSEGAVRQHLLARFCNGQAFRLVVVP